MSLQYCSSRHLSLPHLGTPWHSLPFTSSPVINLAVPRIPVGWLEPLLTPIAKDPLTVVCPVIDVISDDTFEYHYRDSTGVNVGGFDWNLQVWFRLTPTRRPHVIPQHFGPSTQRPCTKLDNASSF
ncbi:putative polypeptide N-acetylgalactosaminyltransferase 9 [Portunus trituberculatus]|uniref:Putative polypeptide N-acetylgalactosaminyltransferase 9 n=1 Tax=Portunus trituberculatus TaxID=210409 RepID=A0A5B7J8E9_PORTR|nr:putative polypeptide N-acetylgalactosaminyltransferase 9 [Portunus trituberculatus]